VTGAELISAVVLTHDEVDDVEPCLRTLRWAGERVVVDDGTTRETAARAAGVGARVVVHPFADFASQRNFACQQASRPWIFFVDADERVPRALVDEVAARVADAERDGAPAGFWVPRQNLIMGHWMRHAGWSPDAQLRVFRRDRGRYVPHRLVHELVELNGESATLSARLVHHNYTSWHQFWTKQLRYARAEALAQHRQGVRAKPQNFVLQPLREFRRRVWQLEGHRDGPLGVSLSAVLAAATFVMYVELARLGRTE
jgi:glycosyltransferase involved in cell wall biosynthesis